MKQLFLLFCLIPAWGNAQEKNDHLIREVIIAINPQKLPETVDHNDFHDDLAFAYYSQLSSTPEVTQKHMMAMCTIYLPELLSFCNNFKVNRLQLKQHKLYTMNLQFSNAIPSKLVYSELFKIPYVETVMLSTYNIKHVLYAAGTIGLGIGTALLIQNYFSRTK